MSKRIANDPRYYCENDTSYAKSCKDLDCYQCNRNVGKTPIKMQLKFYMPIFIIAYSILTLLGLFFQSFSYQKIASVERNHYICGGLITCSLSNSVQILAGSVTPLSDTSMTVVFSNKETLKKDNGDVGTFVLHRTMLLDCKNKRYQIIGSDGKSYDSKWKSYDSLSNKVLDIVIKPEARALYK